MHQRIDKKIKLYVYLFILLILSTFNNQKLINSSLFDFKIDKIEVSGLSEKNNLIILEEIKKIFLGNIFFIKKDLLLEVLKKNNLINSFEIKKIYPDTLEIKIEKTKFLGLTNINGNSFFIGANGKLIKYNDSRKKLPYVFGKINIKNFIEFIETIKKSKFKLKKVKEIYYFPSGRWDIKTKNDQIFKLPIENLLSKLDTIENFSKNPKFKDAKIIDLRFKNKIIMSNE